MPDVTPHEVRTRFSRAMSTLYREEVPQYGVLLDLVERVNHASLAQARGGLPDTRPDTPPDSGRLGIERHGAIRVGTARELKNLRRIFAVMGMEPVGYYDLASAGLPVHATAFRPVTAPELAANPFRVFTSLLRLELIADPALRAEAAGILQQREIFTPQALALTRQFEETGGFTCGQADDFVREVMQTFRWHARATVPAATYQRLHAAHRLIADVVCFPGPHINHLTPRTLDIDAVQAAMQAAGMAAKDVIEGPPRRQVPILLRQTSFQALEEPVRFAGGQHTGAHTARFGEVEQRGLALTRKGRWLYDQALRRAREGDPATPYERRLADAFANFPDDAELLRQRGMGYFRYAPTGRPAPDDARDLDSLVRCQAIRATPITYEDFLPVSAAGIFRSNLGGAVEELAGAAGAQSAFEAALGRPVLDEFALYEGEQNASIDATLEQLRTRAPLAAP